MKITEDMMRELLRKAGAIKDKIMPLCDKKALFYRGRTKGWEPCFKCYPELRKTHKLVLKLPPVCLKKCEVCCFK